MWLLFLSACNVDSVTANGVLGRLTFSLSSAAYLEPSDLTGVSVVTGHPQSVLVGTSDAGARAADGREGLLLYRVSPSDGVYVEQGARDEDLGAPPALALTVTQPGDYTLEATLDGDVFDYLPLTFDAPSALELALFTRVPYGDDFTPTEAPLTVVEGTQLAWLAIPLGPSGDRLAGQIATSFSADPAGAVVPAADVAYVNEDEVYTDTTVPSVYFIEPGLLSLIVSDDVNPASASVAVTVTE